MDYEYSVVKNNDLGIVLVYPILAKGRHSPAQHDIGMFGIAIDKTNMKMVRGNITHGDVDKTSSIKGGPCTK